MKFLALRVTRVREGLNRVGREHEQGMFRQRRVRDVAAR